MSPEEWIDEHPRVKYSIIALIAVCAITAMAWAYMDQAQKTKALDQTCITMGFQGGIDHCCLKVNRTEVDRNTGMAKEERYCFTDVEMKNITRRE